MPALTIKRGMAVAVAAGALFAGAAVAPATADPSKEAIYLAAMKKVWNTQSTKTHNTTCLAYRVAPQKLIDQSVANTMKDPSSKNALTRTEWRSVITDYLAWACSGPGTTPR